MIGTFFFKKKFLVIIPDFDLLNLYKYLIFPSVIFFLIKTWHNQFDTDIIKLYNLRIIHQNNEIVGN